MMHNVSYHLLWNFVMGQASRTEWKSHPYLYFLYSLHETTNPPNLTTLCKQKVVGVAAAVLNSSQ